MPGPLPAVGLVLSFIAKKGAKEAVKKYGKQAVDAATKYARRDKKPKPRRTLKQEKRAKENKIAAGLLGAQGAAAATVIGGNIYAGAKAGERRRKELAEKKRKQLFEDKKKTPVKKSKGGTAEEKKKKEKPFRLTYPKKNEGESFADRLRKNTKKISEGDKSERSLTGIPERRRDKDKKKNKKPIKKAQGGMVTKWESKWG